MPNQNTDEPTAPQSEHSAKSKHRRTDGATIRTQRQIKTQTNQRRHNPNTAPNQNTDEPTAPQSEHSAKSKHRRTDGATIRTQRQIKTQTNRQRHNLNHRPQKHKRRMAWHIIKRVTLFALVRQHTMCCVGDAPNRPGHGTMTQPRFTRQPNRRPVPHHVTQDHA